MKPAESIHEEDAPSTQRMSRLWWLEDTAPMDAEPPSEPAPVISPAARTFVDWLHHVARENV